MFRCKARNILQVEGTTEFCFKGFTNCAKGSQEDTVLVESKVHKSFEENS